MMINAASQPPNIKAQERITTQEQFALPRNQWQIEVQAWQAAVMSTLQERLSMRVVGPADVGARQFVLPAADAAESALCDAQRVRVGQDFNNVSVFGLVFVFAMGGFIITLSLFLEAIVGVLARAAKSAAMAKALESWFRDDVLQIQRLAYQGQSPWDWTGTKDGDVPIPEASALLGPLSGEKALMKVASPASMASMYLTDRMI